MLKKLKPWKQWVLLLFLSMVLTFFLYFIALPGALLLGPLIAGIVIALGGAQINIYIRAYQGAQAVVGCMIAATLTAEIFLVFTQEWPIFLGIILSSLMMSIGIGWTLSSMGVMPGTTALWGISPGAASLMVVMSERYGADVRLVAFMQYLRVLCVALTTVLVAHFFSDSNAHPLAQPIWSAPAHWRNFAETFLLVAGGITTAWLFKIPSGAMLVPLAFGAILNVSGVITIELPLWLRALAFAIIGWVIGLRFTWTVLRYTFHVLPKIMLSILVFMLFCAGLAVILTSVLNIDLLTAFLATSPGGADVMAIIAASSHVEVSFVMALQVSRLIIVLLIGPPIIRWISNKIIKTPSKHNP